MNSSDKVNILMVDDQPAKLLSYEVILSDLGENLLSASSGREALDALLKNDIAVVLMDVSMPDIDGFELADMIRQHPRFQKTAIIFISGVHMSDLDRIRGYQRGAVDYISVPVVPELLRAKVTVFAELHRKNRQLERLNEELEARVAARNEELRLLNQQLRQRVTELETIMQVLPVGVAVAQDPECRVVTGNAALSELQGFLRGAEPHTDTTSRAAVFENVFSNGQPLAPDQLPLQRAAATGQPVVSQELEVRHSDSGSTWLLSSADPLFDEDGAVRGAVGAFYDVTSRKRMEDTLRERADLLELASEAIIVRDLEGCIIFWNSGAELLYGWPRHDAIGKKLHELLKTEFPAPLEDIELQLRHTHAWSGNLTQRTRDGREVIVASRKALDKNGKAVLEINRDITTQRQVEETLRRAEKLAAMGRVAGIVAHEINNPLDAVTNTFFLLRDHPSLDEDARYLARIGEQELARIAHITKQTLSFYRESQEPVLLSLTDVIDDVLELQSRPMQRSGIRLEKDYRSRGLMHGFPGELKQVFLNLIGNAIQATPSGGRIRMRTVDAHTQGRHAGTMITICDTGSGISPEHARRLFEPFYTTKSAKGTGLGLWISKGIIQKYEGTIDFRSLRFSTGNMTCFRIFIPGTLAASRAPENAGLRTNCGR